MQRALHSHGSLTLLAAAAQESIDIYRGASRAGHTSRGFEQLPEEIQRIRINGVLSALRPDTTPAMLHNQWLTDMNAAGWTKGPANDYEAKTNINMIPFGDLSTDLRREPEIFIQTVRRLASYSGLY